MFSRTIGESEEPIVLVERKGDVAGGGQRRFEASLGECGDSQGERENEKQRGPGAKSRSLTRKRRGFGMTG